MSRFVDKPHDKLFKWAFSHKENARDLLRSFLPAKLLETLELDQIAAASENNVDDALSERFLDRMFSIPFRGTDLDMYILFEHKSWPERWVLFDAAGYSIDVARWFRRNHPEAMGPPMVICVIVYHSANQRTLPSSLHSTYLGPPAACEASGLRVVGLAPVIYDLTRETDVELRKRGMNSMATLVLWVLARARGSQDILGDLRIVRDVILDFVKRPRGRQELSTIFLYITNVSDVTLQNLENFLASEIGPIAHEVYMTFAQALRNEGRADVLRMQLEERFGTVPDEVTERINAAAVEQMNIWIKRVLSARTLDEVFDGTR